MGGLGGIPAGVLSGSDQLLGSVPTGGCQSPVQLVTTAGEMMVAMRTHLVQGPGREQASGNSGPDPGSHMSVQWESAVEGYVLSCLGQRVLARTGSVALGKPLQLSGPQGQVCEQWHKKGSPWGCL